MNRLKLNNETVRRQDRLLEVDDALALLRGGEYGVLSMVEPLDGESGGYGIPMNYAWDGERAIYFHCAPEGHKLDCLRANPKVTFCVVGCTNVISRQFTTAYESVVARGEVAVELSDEERMKALMLLLEKYSPDDRETGVKYAEKSFHRTWLLRLDIAHISGKAKRINP